MDIKPIRSAQDHRAALQELEGLPTAELNTPERARLCVLATLVEAYQAKHFPMQVVGAIDAIKFGADQQGH